jgi:hypothetical protein
MPNNSESDSDHALAPDAGVDLTLWARIAFAHRSGGSRAQKFGEEFAIRSKTGGGPKRTRISDLFRVKEAL